MNLDYKQLPEKGTKIILFDGVCNLCNGAIKFIMEHDKKRQFRYTSLQGELGKQLLVERNIDPSKIDSIILIEDNSNYHHKSGAAIKIAQELKGIYPLMGIFLIVPAFIRDWVYDFIAKNRYNWFGKEESCRIATPEEQELFL